MVAVIAGSVIGWVIGWMLVEMLRKWSRPAPPLVIAGGEMLTVRRGDMLVAQCNSKISPEAAEKVKQHLASLRLGGGEAVLPEGFKLVVIRPEVLDGRAAEVRHVEELAARAVGRASGRSS